MRARARLDHSVVAVSDWEASNRFYRDVVGAELVPAGGVRVAYRLGDTQLNVHGPGVDVGANVARIPVAPGGSDLCFVWPGPIEEAVAHLERHGVEVETGPVTRLGARGEGTSVYFRDPDGSLLEFISYETRPAAPRAGRTTAGRRWRTARVADIDEPSRLADGTAVGEEEALAVVAERDPRAIARRDAFEARYPGVWERLRRHDVRRRLGIRAFGAAAVGAPAGDPLVLPHSEDEERYGREELYVVLAGRARFVCDGEEAVLGAGDALFAEPGAHREAFALETPTLVLVVGGVPGEPYEPQPFDLDAPEGDRPA